MLSDRPTKATSIGLRRTMGADAAFSHIVEACLRHAALNAELIQPDVPEAVHQTRIGLRRTRSALALFKPFLKRKPRKQFDEALRTAGQWLAKARDWDVFHEETLPKLAKRFPDLPVASLQEATNGQRRRAYEFDRSEIVNITRVRPTVMITGAESPIESIAADLLDRQYFIVRRAFRHLDTSEQRHALRKAMKKLRYSTEFLVDLYDPKDVQAFLGHCKETQDVLGKMNDAHTMIGLLTELQDADDLHSALVIPLEWARRREDKADLNLAATMSEFRAAKPFWA